MEITKVNKVVSMAIYVLPVLFVLCSCSSENNGSSGRIYDLGTGLKSRSISFENPTGEPGKGGMASSNLGIGRKGSPAKGIAPGETVVLCNIKGPGTITHIWMTGGFRNQNAVALRSMVIRAYWDDQEHPSIECPLGDFMGSAHAKQIRTSLPYTPPE